MSAAPMARPAHSSPQIDRHLPGGEMERMRLEAPPVQQCANEPVVEPEPHGAILPHVRSCG
jgi:hypothetical protein